MGEADIKALLPQILSTGASLAGLVLVFLGFVVSSFESFEREERLAVRRSFRIRVWLSLTGLTVSVLAALAGFAGQISSATTWFWIGSLALGAATLTILSLALQIALGIE